MLVTCRGIHKLSDSRAEIDCSESYTLTDPKGKWMTGYSAAAASLNRGALISGAVGGSIRDVDYQGREASSIVTDTLTVLGQWQGSLPVTLALRVHYGFDGSGESRLVAELRSALSGRSGPRNRVRIDILHTPLDGATLFNVNNTGNYQTPDDGAYPSSATIDLLVTQMVEPGSPHIDVRADLRAYALPVLGGFESTVSSRSNAVARIRVSAPCPVDLASDSGVFLDENDDSGRVELAAGDESLLCTAWVCEADGVGATPTP